MYKKTITYTDYDNNQRIEDFYFNLNQTELKEMELSTVGGFGAMVERITNALNMPEIYSVFKQIVFKSYGEKTPDGKYLVKSEELSLRFSQTEAYNVLMEEITSNAEAAANFINNVIPQSATQNNAAPTPALVPPTH